MFVTDNKWMKENELSEQQTMDHCEQWVKNE